MKRKAIALLLALLFVGLCFASCSSEEEPISPREKANAAVLDLSKLAPAEQYAKSLDISQNFDSYVGKKVRLTGTYQEQTYHFIIIYDGTCCSNYFEFLYDGAMPAVGDSIELTGTFDYYSDSAGSYPYINVSSLKKI